MKKVHGNATEALSGPLTDGMTVMAGGFGLCGMTLIELADGVTEDEIRKTTQGAFTTKLA